MTPGMIELMMVNPNADSFVREKEQEIATLRAALKDARDALTDAPCSCRLKHVAYQAHRATIRCRRCAVLALPAVRELEGE